MAVDDLVTQGARSSAAIVLSYFAQYNPDPTECGLTHCGLKTMAKNFQTNIFKRIFFKQKFHILPQFSLKFVPHGPTV